MSRLQRIRSRSGYYHIILRGNEKKNIFDVLYIDFKKPDHADDSEISDDNIIIRYERAVDKTSPKFATNKGKATGPKIWRERHYDRYRNSGYYQIFTGSKV